MKKTVIVTLGISAYFHDSAAALLIDGQIVAAAQEERFNRIKNTSDFPSQAIAFCLKEVHLSVHDITEIVFYEKPFLKFERILETFYQNVPRGWRSFLHAIPDWSQRKLFLKREIKKELRELGSGEKIQTPIYFSGHHLSHAASAFYPSPFEEAAVLNIDAVGEWATATVGYGKGKEIKILKEMKFPDSLGLLYSSFTYFLGFKVNEGEYKMMGLSPFGNENAAETKEFLKIIKEKLVTIFDDGSIRMHQKMFKYSYGLRMVDDKKWEQLFGFKKREAKDKILPTHANFSLAIQLLTEEIVLKMAKTAKELTGSENICLAGGVALNCVANGKLHNAGLFKNIWVQPAAGDAGGALGAALAFYKVKYPNEQQKIGKDQMQNALLGPHISDDELNEFTFQNKKNRQIFTDKKELLTLVADKLVEGKIIAWVQGKMEFGPRALGARSILALPSVDGMQSKLNLAVKFREDFRPFAPVMLREEAEKYFGFSADAPYMQFVQKLKSEFRNELPENYMEMDLMAKLNFPRSKFQATTHVDFSSRLQVVTDTEHPLFDLLHWVREKTGDGILVNTSFNRNGEPIVCSINDIFTCFEETKIDYLVINNSLYTKEK